jgi:hypothetical protein
MVESAEEVWFLSAACALGMSMLDERLTYPKGLPIRSPKAQISLLRKGSSRPGRLARHNERNATENADGRDER